MADFEQHELIAAFVEKRLSDNLEAFRTYLPDIYETFSTYQEKRYFLIYDNSGNINVFDREEERVLYGDNPVQETLDNFARYARSPITRPYLVVGSKGSEVNPIHNGAMAKLGEVQKELLIKFKTKVLSSSILSKYERMEVDYSDLGLPERINTLLFLSVGIGFDLEKLYLEYDVRRLLILEPDLDIFYCSLQLIDWAAIINKSVEKNLSIYIAISDDLEQLSQDTTRYLARMGRHNAAGAFLYSGFFKEEYLSLFENIKKEFDVGLFSGFGFYDDSRISVAHTFANLKNAVPCIKSDKEIKKDFGQNEWPVFIIGNGPSLDGEIEFLKENQHRIVIVSSGSALTTLYKNGITPDFHAELERTAHVPVWIKAAADGDEYFEYLRKIRLVAMSQVHPEVFKLFDNKGQMPKDNETGSLALVDLLTDKGVRLIARCAPSCLHVGFTFAVLAGFKDIFFIGADMGFKSKDKHHSKDSLYNKLSDDVKKDHDTEGKKLVEMAANFGDETVYSYRFLPMFKRMLEINIKGWKGNFEHPERPEIGLHVYNCSDGALIEGAEPMYSSDIGFEEKPEGSVAKAELADSIMSSYFAYVPSQDDADAYEARFQQCEDKLKSMCAWLKANLKHVEDEFEGGELVDTLAYRFHTEITEMELSDEDSWLYSFFDGTLLYALSVMQSTLFMPAEKELRIKAFNKSVDILEELFSDIESDYQDNLFKVDRESYYDNYFKGNSQ